MSYLVFKVCAFAILAALGVFVAACYAVKPRRKSQCR